MKGFAYQVYYTLAKDVQDLENNESPEYAYDRRRERTTWGALPRHRFQLNAIYDMPFGKGRPNLPEKGNPGHVHEFRSFSGNVTNSGQCLPR